MPPETSAGHVLKSKTPQAEVRSGWCETKCFMFCSVDHLDHLGSACITNPDRIARKGDTRPLTHKKSAQSWPKLRAISPVSPHKGAGAGSLGQSLAADDHVQRSSDHPGEPPTADDGVTRSHHLLSHGGFSSSFVTPHGFKSKAKGT